MSFQLFPTRQWIVVVVSIYLLCTTDAARERGVRRRSNRQGLYYSDDASSRSSSGNYQNRQYPMTLRTMLSSDDVNVKPHSVSEKGSSKITMQYEIQTQPKSTERRLADTRKKTNEASYSFVTPGPIQAEVVLNAELAPEDFQKGKDKDNKDTAADDGEDEDEDQLVLGANETSTSNTTYSVNETSPVSEVLDDDVDEYVFDEDDEIVFPDDGEDLDVADVAVNAEEQEDVALAGESLVGNDKNNDKDKDQNKNQDDNGEDDDEEELPGPATGASVVDMGGKDDKKDDGEDGEDLQVDDLFFYNMTNATANATDDTATDAPVLAGENDQGEDDDDNDDFFFKPVRDPNLYLIETTPCIKLKKAYVFMFNFQLNEASCMENPDSCTGGCCRLSDHVQCDEVNEFETLPCICNFNTAN